MLLEIDVHGGVPIFRQLLDQLRRQILAGQIPAGAPLPSVRDLAERLRVNPMTVSKTYGLLEREGLAERRRGVGLFAAPNADGQARKFKKELLEDLLKQAAVSAVQFGIPEAEAVELFRKIYQTLLSHQRRSP